MRTRSILTIASVFLAILGFCADVSAQNRRRKAKRPPDVRVITSAAPGAADIRQRSFLMAWATINEHYFDKTFGGLDWVKIRREYQPRVTAAKTDLQFHRLLEEMINRLGKSHLDIVVPEYFEQIRAAKENARRRERERAGKPPVEPVAGQADDEKDDSDIFGSEEETRYGTGIELRLLGKQLVVTRVDKDSGATLAGIKPGFIIEKINDVSIAALVDEAIIGGTSAAEIEFLLPASVVVLFLNGEPDTSVFLTCLDEADKSREFTVPRLKLDGQAVSLSNNLPEQFLKYRSASIDSDVGYIRFNAFVPAVVAKFCDSLTEFKNKKAVIIDLRGNFGGILGTMLGLGGMLTDRAMPIGTYIARSNNEEFTAASRKRHFKGKVIVLVDAQSMSAAELFAAALQGTGRALLVGEQTAGKALPAVWTKLPSGAVMMYPQANFLTPKGVSLEGKGLMPDHPITLDRKMLLRGADPQFDKALALARDDSVVVKQTQTTLAGLEAIAPPPPPKAIPTQSKTAPPVEMRLERLTALGPAPTPTPTPTASDSRSLQLVADFAAAIGGIEAIKAVAAYEVKGRGRLENSGEADTEFTTVFQKPDKYMSVSDTASLGEVRNIYNGKNLFMQTGVGYDRETPSGGIDLSRFGHILAPIFNTIDATYLRGLKFEGEYPAEGQLRQVVSATDTTGINIGLSFDAKTKLLSTYSMPGLMYTFSDYRLVNGLRLPFKITTDRGFGSELSSITINPKIAVGTFEKKDMCFDRAN